MFVLREELPAAFSHGLILTLRENPEALGLSSFNLWASLPLQPSFVHEVCYPWGRVLRDLRPLGDGSPWGPSRAVLCRGEMWEVSAAAPKSRQSCREPGSPSVLAAISLSFSNLWAWHLHKCGKGRGRDQMGLSQLEWLPLFFPKRGKALPSRSIVVLPLFPAGWAHRCCDSEGRGHLQGRKDVRPGSGGRGAVCWCVCLSPSDG